MIAAHLKMLTVLASVNKQIKLFKSDSVTNLIYFEINRIEGGITSAQIVLYFYFLSNKLTN